MSDILKNDVDPIETLEWLASLESLLREEGPQRAQFILEQLAEKARVSGVDVAAKANRDYINTIPSSDEPAYPGDLEMERRIRAIIRWNAMMIVLRASKKDLDLGGHMSSFASSATIYEVHSSAAGLGPLPDPAGRRAGAIRAIWRTCLACRDIELGGKGGL